MFNFLVLLAAFLPAWVVVLLLAVATVFVVMLVIKLIAFIKSAIPFL